MIKVLVVVDMQNDFIDGALGTSEALCIVPNAVKKIKEFDGDEIYVTYDTHYDNYLSTLEGKKLPFPHCIKGTDGYELYPAIKEALKGKNYTEIPKETFGTSEIAHSLKEKYPQENVVVEFIGLCTDICVITNALIMRAEFPNSEISVDASCCAGVTPDAHTAALTVMKSCQIDIAE